MLNYKNIVQLTQQINNNELHKNGMSTKLSTMHENHNISWLFFQAILCDFFSKANYIYRTCDFLRQYYVTFQKKMCGRKCQQQLHKQTTSTHIELAISKQSLTIPRAHCFYQSNNISPYFAILNPGTVVGFQSKLWPCYF